MAGPAIVPNRSPGLLVRFSPYASLSDTTRVRELAEALWHQLVPRLDSEGISWLVLQAVDERDSAGFVFERGADSAWHRIAKPDSILGALADSAALEVPNLAGRWRISGMNVTELIYLTLSQQGSQVRGEIVRHRECLGKDVKVVIELEGRVDPHAVDLWSTTGHVEGEFINPCSNLEFSGRVEFHGQIAADGKKVTGPFAVSGVRSDTWILSR